MTPDREWAAVGALHQDPVTGVMTYGVELYIAPPDGSDAAGMQINLTMQIKKLEDDDDCLAT